MSEMTKKINIFYRFSLKCTKIIFVFMLVSSFKTFPTNNRFINTFIKYLFKLQKVTFVYIYLSIYLSIYLYMNEREGGATHFSL